MYSAIQELFYGSYSASDLPTSNVPGYRESLRHTIELSEQLRAGLSQEQKELFEAYCENANAGHALMGEAYFAQGLTRLFNHGELPEAPGGDKDTDQTKTGGNAL